MHVEKKSSIVRLSPITQELCQQVNETVKENLTASETALKALFEYIQKYNPATFQASEKERNSLGQQIVTAVNNSSWNHYAALKLSAAFHKCLPVLQGLNKYFPTRKLNSTILNTVLLYLDNSPINEKASSSSTKSVEKPKVTIPHTAQLPNQIYIDQYPVKYGREPVFYAAIKRKRWDMVIDLIPNKKISWDYVQNAWDAAAADGEVAVLKEITDKRSEETAKIVYKRRIEALATSPDEERRELWDLILPRTASYTDSSALSSWALSYLLENGKVQPLAHLMEYTEKFDPSHLKNWLEASSTLSNSLVLVVLKALGRTKCSLSPELIGKYLVRLIETGNCSVEEIRQLLNHQPSNEMPPLESVEATIPITIHPDPARIEPSQLKIALQSAVKTQQTPEVLQFLLSLGKVSLNRKEFEEMYKEIPEQHPQCRELLESNFPEHRNPFLIPDTAVRLTPHRSFGDRLKDWFLSSWICKAWQKIAACFR
jgi:hypothetical protein